MSKVAVYPGSFDPITKGHVDIIQRASKMFDKLVVAVLINTNKSGLFTLDERVDMINNCVKDLGNVEVQCFSGLLTDYCKKNKIYFVIRGLRAISDFEIELQMAHMNKYLYDELETLFLATDTNYSYISSSVVKEIAYLGGDCSDTVLPYVKEKLREKVEEIQRKK